MHPARFAPTLEQSPIGNLHIPNHCRNHEGIRNVEILKRRTAAERPLRGTPAPDSRSNQWGDLRRLLAVDPVTHFEFVTAKTPAGLAIELTALKSDRCCAGLHRVSTAVQPGAAKMIGRAHV